MTDLPSAGHITPSVSLLRVSLHFSALHLLWSIVFRVRRPVSWMLGYLRLGNRIVP